MTVFENGAQHNWVNLKFAIVFVHKKVGFKVLKCLIQCFAQVRFQNSVSSKTAVDPASMFCECKTLFPIEVVQNTDLRI